jgi:hypothetical protein
MITVLTAPRQPVADGYGAPRICGLHTEDLAGCQVSQGLATTMACPSRFQARHDGRMLIRLSSGDCDYAPVHGLSSNDQSSCVTNDTIFQTGRNGRYAEEWKIGRATVLPTACEEGGFQAWLWLFDVVWTARCCGCGVKEFALVVKESFEGGLGQSKVRAATEAATLDGGRACPGDLGPQQRCMRHQTNVASWPRPGKVASAAGTGGTGGEDG